MISEKHYYAEKRVSSSSLKWFEESPKMFRKQLDKEIAQIQASWLDTGRQIHMSILEPDVFDKSYIYLEYTIPKSQNQKDFCEEYVNLANKFVDNQRKIEAYSKAYAVKGKSEDKIKEEANKLYKSLRHYIEYLEKSSEYKEVMTKSKWDLIQKGALVYITSDGFIIEAKNIPNDFETTFPQVIDFEVIKTSLYQRYAYYKVEDGNVIIDQDKYKKYKGAILL